MAPRNQRPKPGDLIEIDRPIYQHWAVYIGDEYVVHLVSDVVPGKMNKGKEDWASSLYLSVNTKKAVVKKHILSEVIEGNNWRINNKYDTKYAPKPAQEVVAKALRMIGKKIDYNVVTMNCEHFVTNLRYGQHQSDQVVRGAGLLGVIGGLGMIVAGGFAAIASLIRQ